MSEAALAPLPSERTNHWPSIAVAAALLSIFITAVFIAAFRIRIFIDTQFEVALTTTQMVLTFIGSALAVRGDTYQQNAPVAWYRKITWAGRVAIAILALSFALGVIEKIRDAASEGETATRAQEQLKGVEASMQATFKVRTDSLVDVIEAAKIETSSIINMEMKTLSDSERRHLQRRFDDVLGGVGNAARQLDDKMSGSAVALSVAIDMLKSLAKHDSALAIQVSNSEVRLVDHVSRAFVAADTAFDRRLQFSRNDTRSAVQEGISTMRSTVLHLDSARGAEMRGQQILIDSLVRTVQRTAADIRALRRAEAESVQSQASAKQGSTDASQ